MLEFGKQKVDRLVRVVGDDHPSRPHSGLADIVFSIRQPVENRRDDLWKMGLEAGTKGGRQEDQQRHETFPDRASRGLSIGNDVGQKTFHALHTKACQYFTETLSGTLPIDSRSVCFESAEKVWHKVGEVCFTHAFHKGTECLSCRCSRFRYWVHKYDVNEWQKFREVRYEVFRVRKRSKISNNLRSFPLGLRTALS